MKYMPWQNLILQVESDEMDCNIIPKNIHYDLLYALIYAAVPEGKSDIRHTFCNMCTLYVNIVKMHASSTVYYFLLHLQNINEL